MTILQAILLGLGLKRISCCVGTLDVECKLNRNTWASRAL